jgi:RimJ/RimL family protein N-acetyltransferase
MTDGTVALTTPRLRLVPATDALIEAELGGLGKLGPLLEADVPFDWPPEHHDTDTLRFWRDALKQPGATGWWLHYALLATPGRATLVGSVGYKGPPADGVVEIGYSVVPSYRRKGLATEACRALIESAWARGAEVVIAHTLEGLEPSIGVLRKLGFAPTDPLEPSAIAFALRRPERRLDLG